MRLLTPMIVAACIGAMPAMAASPASPWDGLKALTVRQWTTEQEPQERTSIYEWTAQGRILVGKHGPTERLPYGDEFADTLQRFVLSPDGKSISVTYSYRDGRPPLKTTIRALPGGISEETFTDAQGQQRRNLYRSPGAAISLIERQILSEGAWRTQSTTRRAGLTQDQIAANARQLAADRHQRSVDMAAADAENRAMLERGRIQKAASDAAYQRGLQQGLNDALVNMATPPGMTPQQAAFEAENHRRTQAAIAARGSSFGGYSASGGGGQYGSGGIVVERTALPPPPQASGAAARPPPPAGPVYEAQTFISIEESGRAQAGAPKAATGAKVSKE